MSDKVTRLVNSAKALRHDNFGGSQHNQCANFVRKAFGNAGFNLGHTNHPTDSALVGKNLGDSFADSFAGNEVGEKVPLSKAQAGDIIMFKDTDPSYKSGTITHVGICLDNKTMIDRGGSAVNIREWSVWPGVGSVVEVRRPNCLKEPHAPKHVTDKAMMGAGIGGASGGDPLKQFKMFFHNNQLGGHLGSGPLPSNMEIRIKLTNGKVSMSVDHESVFLEALTLEVKTSGVLDKHTMKVVRW